MTRDVAISIAEVRMSYLRAEVLHGVTAEVPAGALTLLTGPSGSGKTTLLNLVGALDRPDGGTIHVRDAEVTGLSPRERTTFRAGLGLVFQRSGLIRGLTARENIEVPHFLSRHAIDQGWVTRLAEALGVGDVIEQSSQTLSGGQAQRIAVVRALAHRPSIVLADEPTASVDSATKILIHEVLRDYCRSGGTVLLVSHEAMSGEYADQVMTMESGQIIGIDGPKKAADAHTARGGRRARR